MAIYDGASGVSASGSTSLSVTNATKVVPPGYMGEFGNGLWQVFFASGNFVIPANVTKIRVRVVGGGGGGRQNGAGGAGGGYAHGVFTVVPGASYAVTVGTPGSENINAPTAGGTSSFGALISATGGGAAIAAGGAVGGVGIGGDYQASGGSVGASAAYGGGAGAGSQLGKGGDVFGYGGAGVLGSSRNLAGGSPFGDSITLPNGQFPGPDALGKRADGTPGVLNAMNAIIRFPFDGFTGGGGAPVVNGDGGIGAGGGATSTTSGSGRDGGGGGGTTTNSGTAGSGGIGGGGGSTGGAGGQPGRGGQGLVIVEW